MADKRHSKQESASQKSSGAGQIIVSLEGVNESGVTFCSRHRFELASEIQMRVRWDVLPDAIRVRLAPDDSGWVSVRGFVIECRAERQSDGAAIFRVALVLDTVLLKRVASLSRVGPTCCGRGERELFGLN